MSKEVASPDATGRGREARWPHEIPLSGWRDILLRTWADLGADNVALIAAGVAFYSLLALFPGIAILVSIYGLLADPVIVTEEFARLRGLLPDEAWTILNDQLRAVSSRPDLELSLTAIFGTLLTLVSARSAAVSLIQALNIIYHQRERRSFLAQNLLALAFTLGFILFLGAALTVIVGTPIMLGFAGLEPLAEVLVSWLRWPVLAVVVMTALAAFYKYAPHRRPARWSWVNLGSVTATALWLSVSALFSWYVGAFGTYNETYGSLGAVIILLLWLWLSAFFVLLGAELNMQIEHQTGIDTTIGEPKPMGERGAHVADTIGRKP